MEDLLVSLACQLIVSKTELKIVVQKTQNRRSATTIVVGLAWIKDVHYVLCEEQGLFGNFPWLDIHDDTIKSSKNKQTHTHTHTHTKKTPQPDTNDTHTQQHRHSTPIVITTHTHPQTHTLVKREHTNTRAELSGLFHLAEGCIGITQAFSPFLSDTHTHTHTHTLSHVN